MKKLMQCSQESRKIKQEHANIEDLATNLGDAPHIARYTGSVPRLTTLVQSADDKQYIK